MIILAIILIVIILIALLRLGVSAEYSAGGMSVVVRAGPLALSVFPRKMKWKPEGKKKKRPKKPKKKKEKKAKPEAKKPGAFKTFLDILSAASKSLSRLRRRLLIKELTIHFIAAGDDPAKAAIGFGASNAVFGMVVPVLEKAFRIKRCDLRSSADFDATEAYIYLKASISLAVWEAIYIASAFLPVIMANIRKQNPKEKSIRKDGQKDGEAPDK